MAAGDELNNSIAALTELIQSGNLDREVALAMLPMTATRIFEAGLDANGAPIGKYTKGYIRQRRRKGWGSSDKVILQLTQEMRNDFQVIVDGGIGLGFSTKVNGDKSRWVEKTYKKDIFQHTESELEKMEQLYGKIIERHINRD